MKPYTSPHDDHEFASRSYALKLYSGTDSLALLPQELTRLNIRRGVVLCGRSVHEKATLIQRIAVLMGDRCAGIYPQIPEGAPAASIEAAANWATDLGADGIVAVGAGSVLKGARVVAMMMAEGKPLCEMATQYVPGKLPSSPRLRAPKCPIVNVLTAPTTAQNRAGSALRVQRSGQHQLEFFDPKTRPSAIFWDTSALATAPESLIRSTGLEVYFVGLMTMGALRASNPIVKPGRRHAWELARSALPRVGDASDTNARLELCAAAFLENRDEDDGGNPMNCHLIMRATYSLSVAIFNRCQGITQSHGYAALTGSAIRAFGLLVPDVVQELGSALGVRVAAGDVDARYTVAAAADAAFKSLAWPTNLSAARITEGQAEELISLALRNFNANGDGVLTAHVDLVRETLLGSLNDR